MKRPNSIMALTVLPVISIISFLIWNFYSSSQSDTMSKEIDEFIKVDKLSDKAIVVRMGYDAVTAIATQNGIVVIDAGISHSLTAEYRKVIEKVFDRNDFAYLINTHSHPDHIGGNQVFSEAVIIGHEACLNEIPGYWKDIEKIKTGLLKIISDYENQIKSFDPEWQDSLEIYLQKIRYENAYNDLLNNHEVTLPTKTFNDTMSISMGDVTFNLIYFGKAHSGSDIIIHIPEEKILMVGDSFSEYGRPSIMERDKINSERWMFVNQWINDRLNNIDKVIGGHGQIMERKDLQSFIQNITQIRKELK